MNRRWSGSGSSIALALLLGIGSCLLAIPAAADEATEAETSLARHPLEVRALHEPEAVLKLLPGLIEGARSAGDSHELARLLLAQANACRVVADWPCQRVAGAAARMAAEAARQPILLVRALISESRALIAMQDFSRGERLLGHAELVLKTSPSPELSADVFLAYSSLSYSLGKHALSAEYAARGLAVLSGDRGLPMQARLLRNQARAQAHQGQARAAEESLQRARMLAERFDDPKLSAELLFGAARMARMAGDVAAQIRSGERVLELAARLKNSQLVGMGHEVLGLAALDKGDEQLANKELRTAYDSFRGLGLKRDELRVLRELLRVAIDQDQPRAVVGALALRFLEIDSEIQASDRAKAAGDFDARLKYAEREMDVLRLKGEAVLASERESALAQSNRQSQRLMLLAAAMLFVLSVFFMLQRRSNRQLEAALSLLRESEARAYELHRVLHEQSVRDALTGSYNRRQLQNFEASHPRDGKWAAISVDLDHFKQVNDTQGHDRGDQVLTEIAQYLFARVGAEDAVVRLGGDEFVLLLPGADAETMQATAGRLRHDVAAAPCGFSIGMALRECDESLATTIARADAAMYTARAAARSQGRTIA